MKRKLLVGLILSVNYLYPAMLHYATKFIPKAEGKSAFLAASQKFNNFDLPRIAEDYWKYLKDNKGHFVDLINEKTRKEGLRQEGLNADDIRIIETWIREHFMRSLGTPVGFVDPVIEFAHSKLPQWLEDEFDNLTYKVALEWEVIAQNTTNLDPNTFGDIRIRKGIMDYIIQKTTKKYVYANRSYNQSPVELKNQLFFEQINSKKRELENKLIHESRKYQSIESIHAIEDVFSGVEYIIVRANDLPAVLATLNAILDPNTGNPRLNIVVAFDDDATIIPAFFNNQMVPPSIRNLIVIGSSITAIGSFFLDDCSGLKVLDLTGLSNVTHIGDFFLDNCSGLKALDLRALSNVTQIGRSFLGGCSRLTALDLTALSNVTRIGDYFLINCSGLTALDLTALSNVTQIESFFLSGCLRLTALDLTALSNVTHIGDFFLDNCSGLTKMTITRKLYDKLDKEKLFDFSRLRQNKTITIIEDQSAAAVAKA